MKVMRAFVVLTAVTVLFGYLGCSTDIGEPLATTEDQPHNQITSGSPMRSAAGCQAALCSPTRTPYAEGFLRV